MKKTTVLDFLMVMIIIVSTFADYALSESYGFITILSPAVGVSIVYYFMKGKQFYTKIILTYGLTLLLSRFILFDEELVTTFLVVLFKLLTLSFMMITISYFLNRLKNYGYDGMKIRDIVNFVLVGTIITLIGSSFNLIPIYYLFELDNAMFWFGNAFIGYWFGYLIFGSTLSYSLLGDEEFVVKKFKTVYAVLFVLVTTFVLIYLISEHQSGFSIDHFGYLIFLFYIIAVLFFEFRMVLIFDLLFLSVYGLFGQNHSLDHSLFLNLVSVNIFLLTLTATAALLRKIINELQEKDIKNEQTNQTITELISATNQIFSDFEQITNEKGHLSNSFLSKMFLIANDLLPKFDCASFYVKDNGKVRYVNVVGYDLEHLNSIEIPAKNYRWGTNKAKIITGKNDVYSEYHIKENQHLLDNSINQSIRFAIHFESEPVAGMSFDITGLSTELYTDNDLSVYNEFCSLINSYFNVTMIQNVNNNLRNDIVKSLVRTLGLYDSYTGTHSEEVAFLTLEISKRLGLSTTVTNRIYWSAIVHDIGKIGISASLLNKSEKLTQAEKKQIEDHSINGYNILSKSQGLEEIALRVKHHHERWDGTGYPSKLKGQEIPLCSQVLCVCDAVSAMAKERVYSKAMTVNEIIGELYSNKGKQFSPLVVDKMIDYINDTHLEEFYSFKSELI